MTTLRRVLVVDDDTAILEVLDLRLTGMGFAVTPAATARQALAAVENERFDVALIDLRMDPVDGIELMEAVHARQPRLPVLIMTAHGTIETAVEAVQRGAFDYLTKPFVRDELRAKITRALATRRWARDRARLLAVFALGMAFPLFLLALLWERFQLGTRAWLRGREVAIGPLRLHTTNIISGLVFVAIGLGAVAAFWNYYAVPAKADIDARQATLMQVRAEINRGQITARRLPAFRQEVATLELQLKQLRAVLPEERDVADLLNRINAMAIESNLKFLAFIPAATTKKTLHTEWPIGLRLEGSYHDLGMFLERISKFPRIVNVGNMRVKARETHTARSTVTIDVTATTFVLAEQPKPAIPVAGPGRGGA